MYTLAINYASSFLWDMYDFWYFSKISILYFAPLTEELEDLGMPMQTDLDSNTKNSI